jgi:hypothetical protein
MNKKRNLIIKNIIDNQERVNKDGNSNNKSIIVIKKRKIKNKIKNMFRKQLKNNKNKKSKRKKNIIQINKV